jgi:hypothetical protein
MAKRQAIRRMIFAGQTLVLASIMLGILTFGSRKIVYAIGVVAFGEALWAASWIMRGFTHPDK